MKLRWRMVLVVALAAVVSGPGRSDEKDLPKAEELMDNFVKVTGGEAAYRKFKTRTAEGTLNIPGIEAPLKIYQKAPNFLFMEADLPGVGAITMGTDGKVAWEMNPITGAKIKSGESKAQALREANFYGDVEWRKLYKSVKTTGEETVDKAPCYIVELTTAEGKTTTKFFDKKTGYVVKFITTVESDAGKIKTESYISDYKKIDGLMYPHTIKASAAGQNITIALTKVQHDGEIAASKFALPDDVKKLVEKEKQQ